MWGKISDTRVGFALAAIIAILIQFQPTVAIFGHETRLAASDPMVALISGIAAAAILLGAMPNRIWRSQWIWAWLAAMTIVLLVGLGRSYLETGIVSSWALQNRVVGWFVLLAYLLGGASLRVCYGRAAAIRFMSVFIITGSAVAALGVASAIFAGLSFFGWSLFDSGQMRGFVENPNAYGMMVVLGLAGALAVGPRPIGPMHGMLSSFWAMAGYLTVSRATWLACLVTAGFLLAVRWIGWRPVVLWAAAPVALLGAVLAVSPVGLQASAKLDAVTQRSSGAEAERIRLAKTALDLWYSAPLLGVGLGVHWERERASVPDRPQLIHGTPLWLLAETGLVGFVVFGGFALHAILLPWRALRPDAENAVESVAVAFLLGAFVMILFHEMMYQRILWMMLGLALGTDPARAPERAGGAVEVRASS